MTPPLRWKQLPTAGVFASLESSQDARVAARELQAQLREERKATSLRTEKRFAQFAGARIPVWIAVVKITADHAVPVGT